MKKTFKKLILISILVLTLLIISSCTSIPKNCKSLEGSSKDNCIIQEAVAQKNADFCKSFKEEAQNNWCYHDVAKATNNTELCNSIFNKESQDYCKRDIILANNNLEGCSSLSGLAKDDCFVNFANSRKDWHLCEQVNDYNLRDDCLLKIAKSLVDPSICLEMSDNNLEEKDHCIYLESIKSLNSQYCSKINSEGQRNACFLTTTIKIGDISKCEELIPEMKAICLKELNNNTKELKKN